MVREIDYINARVRGMMGRLLSEDHLHQVIGAASVREWMALLGETPYSGELGGSVPLGDPNPLLGAIDRSAASRTHKLSGIASGRPAAAVTALLAEWDLKNLLSLLSGIHHRSRPTEILTSTLAGGFLAQDQLESLAHASSLKEAADRLTTWKYPYSLAFKRAIGRGGDRPLIDMRLELTRGLVEHIHRTAKASGFHVLRRYLRDRTDQMNLMTAFMWRTLPTDRGPGEFFVEAGGNLTLPAYVKVVKASDTDEIIQILPRGILTKAIGRASILFELEGRSSIFLQALEREIHFTYTRLRYMDPLDISLLLAYLLTLHREGVLIKLALVRITMDIPEETFREVVGDV